MSATKWLLSAKTKYLPYEEGLDVQMIEFAMFVKLYTPQTTQLVFS